MSVSIRRVTKDDAEVLKDIRLRALKADPHAFSSTYEETVYKDESYWSEWSEDCSVSKTRITFLAFDGSVCVGILGVIIEEMDQKAFLCTMWVDERYRKQGVGRDLVGCAEAWVQEFGIENLAAWVTEHNPEAYNFYLGLGFKPTGENQPHPPDPTKLEIQTMKKLV